MTKFTLASPDISDLLAEVERLRAENTTLREPSGYWDDEGTSYLPDDLFAVEPEIGGVVELRAYRELHTCYLAITPDADSDFTWQLFNTEEEAKEAALRSEPVDD